MNAMVQGTPLKSGLILLLVAFGGTLILTLTNRHTHEIIQENEDRERLVVVDQILPAQVYDNRMLRDSIKLAPNPLLGTRETTLAFRARLKGAPAAVVFEAVGPDGYGGKFRIMVAILKGGTVAGVRVLAHNETPGWGDYIEIAKSPWIRVFERKSLGPHPAQDWQVRKDGGRFEFVTRATVSARAVVKAVSKTLQYYAAHEEQLYSTESRLVP